MSKDITKAAEANSAIVSAADAKAAHKLAEAKATVALKLQVAEQAQAMKLEAQAQIIRDQHAKVVELGQSALVAGIAIGHALIKAKALFGKHGSWQKWQADNLPFSDRTAQVYTKLAENEKFLMMKHAEAKAQNSAGLSLKTAMKELRGPTRKNNKSSKKTTKPTASATSGEPTGTVAWFVALAATLKQVVNNPTALSTSINATNREAMQNALRELQWAATTLADAVSPLLDKPEIAPVDIQQANVVATSPHEDAEGWLKVPKQKGGAAAAHA